LLLLRSTPEGDAVGTPMSEEPGRPNAVSSCVALAERVFSVKKCFLAMYRKANAGHVGSSLSCAEILVFLKFAWMRDHDTLLLSKGHAAAGLYAVLAEAGLLSAEDIASFYEDGTSLPALTPCGGIKEIPFATGSLGHGLSLAAGMALGARLDGRDKRVFCVTSDGELDEGSVWEAALFIAHQQLGHVIWIIDRNRIQGIGRTEDVLALEPLDAKLRSFGFQVMTVDGHDLGSLFMARHACNARLGVRSPPLAIIANTVKGNGLGVLQDTVDSHYLPMSDAQYGQVLEALAVAHAGALARYQVME
jgi:transketolase